MRVLLTTALLLLPLGGCLTHHSVATTRATNDLSCPKESVVVTNIGGTSYRAKGCDKEATYNCLGGGDVAITCVREEQKEAAE